MANQGKGEGGLGDVCQVNCVSLGTGQCPVLTGQPRLSQAIAVGGIQTLKLDNLRYPVGEYRLTVTPSSAPEGMLAQKLSVLPQPHIAPAMGAAAGQLGQSTGVENSNLPGSARRALKHP